ncbi:MAG: hypothetical protein QOH96_527 [Blastocatellia bacterium]|nr:hypothetical protein [Blastocatellia bacterium]
MNAGSNAARHPPRTQAHERQVLRMKAALFAVGYMPFVRRLHGTRGTVTGAV